MKNLIKRSTIVVMSCLIFTGLVQAGPHHPSHHLEKLDKKLDLSDAQEKSVGAILEANHDAIMAEKKNVKSLKKQIKALLKSDSLDESQVRALHLQMAEHSANLMILKTQTNRQIEAELTDAQANKLAKMRKAKQAHHAHDKAKKSSR